MPDHQRKKDDEPDRVIIRDKRRIDPVTGQQRDPDPDRATGAVAGAHEIAHSQDAQSEDTEQMAALEASVAERTADLQRLQAEYANYRKRVERDRVTVRDIAVRDVLVSLLPILDDIDRARRHDDLTGAFKAVADQLDVTLTKIGLESFGDEGDSFDPSVHEAVTHTESDDVSEPTVTLVMRRGYRYADRLVRPAMVGVSEPAHVTATGDEPASDASDAPDAE